MAQDEKIYTAKGAYYPPTHPMHKIAMNLLKEEAAKKNPAWWAKTSHQTVPVDKQITGQDLLEGRRADLKSKSIESLPTVYDKETIGNLMKALKASGVQVNPDEMTNILLREGRSNFGFNDFDYNNKKAAAIRDNLIQQGHDPYAASFPAAIYDKQQLANRLKVPFPQAWNGSGPEARKYAKELEASKYAIEHEKNQPLREFIYNSLGQKLPIKKAEAEQLSDQMVAMAPTEEEQVMKKGGTVKMPNSYSNGSWKLI
jgi:hypothetical protein